MRSELKHIILWVTAIILAMLAETAFAQVPPQNTGDDPYIGTTHRYVVTADQPSINTITWEITDGSDTYDPTHVTIDTSSSGNLQYIDVEYQRGIYAEGTWTLTYTEENADEGCVATREFTIYLTENTFYESLYNIVSETPPGSFSDCHDSTGTAQSWSVVSATTYSTDIVFPVYMYKDEDFDLVTWSFEATVSVSGTGYSLSDLVKGASVSGLSADFTITNIDADTWAVEVDSATGTYDADSILLVCTVEGPMYENCDVTLLLENGEATSGVSITVTTPDNESVYPDVSGTPSDYWRTKTVTILGVPGTRDIAHDAGEGETAWSASHPLQNSTHNYTVQMGDFANNLGNANTGWHIEEASNPGVIYSTGFTLTPEYETSPNAEAEIEITDAMPLGNYVLVFTEESDAGCTTLRTYPFEVLGPFDVDIALTNSATDDKRCPGISGSIVENADITTATTTTISYTITLGTADYDAAWSFNLGVATAGVFDPADVDVPAAAITVTGGTYTVSDNYSGHVDVAALTTSVTIEVAYEGFYVNEHDITVSLTNITGSFSESDANPTNAVTHTIYSMPQPLALEGVD